MNHANENAPATSSVEAFLDQAVSVLGEDSKTVDTLSAVGGHRTLRVLVSDDRLVATLEGIYPDTTHDEVEDALKQAHIRWGIDEAKINKALQKANESGHVLRDVVVALGKPAVYIKRRKISYPFLDGLKMPETGEDVHLASSVIRKVSEAMSLSDIEHVRAYALPVVAVESGALLMKVVGEDEIEPGRDVLGKEIKRVLDDDERRGMKAGDGVTVCANGDIEAAHYGYVTIRNQFLKVLSPIWVSPDNMEAYFFNPSKLGKASAPSQKMIKAFIEEEGIRVGIAEEAIGALCQDLEAGTVREACVRIAQGERLNLSKGQTQFHFDVLPALWFERLHNILKSKNKPDHSLMERDVAVVSSGQVIAVASTKDGKTRAGRDLFDCPVPLVDEGASQPKTYKPGDGVRREVRDGEVVFISEIYGYPGVRGDKIDVLPPIWISPDRMSAYFVAFAKKQIWPSKSEMTDLLEQAHVCFGIEADAVAQVQTHIDDVSYLGCVANGEAPVEGVAGKVELLFKQTLDPGKLIAGDKMDFREREGVPQARPRDLLAKRSFPKPGKPGRDVRGRLIQAPKLERGLLYAGANVVMEENEQKQQLFYATGMGCPRVIKDTLSVQQLYHHQGDVDFHVGNIKMEGDVAIDGSIKNRFRVEATGDVYVGGGVERQSQIIAGGNVIIHRGIVAADVHAKGNLFARFVQESKLHVEGDLVVRNYIRDSRAVVYQKAIIQGDDGGERQLCLLGGDLFAGESVDVASLGSPHGRPTRLMTGISLDVEKQGERYKKGLAFCDLQIRRTMRGLGGLQGKDLAAMLQNAPLKRKKFLLKSIQDLKELQKLRASLTYYLDAFKAEQNEVASKAFVRVHLSAFTKVTLQIQERHMTLMEDAQQSVFRLNDSLDAIMRISITR